MAINLNIAKNKLKSAIKSSGVSAVSDKLKENLTPEQLSGYKERYKAIQDKKNIIGTPVNTKDLSGVQGYEENQVGLPGINLKKDTTNIDLINKDTNNTSNILDEQTSDKDLGISEKNKIEGDLTDLQFKKQGAEEDLLKAQEEKRTKDIASTELDYRKKIKELKTTQQEDTEKLNQYYNDAITSAEIENKNLNHNINMARSGLGMPESKAETEGFNNIVSESRKSLDRLNGLSDTSKKDLTNTYNKQFEDLNIQRKKIFDENMRKLLDEMSISDLEGALDTKEGLSNLRTKLQDILYSDEEMALINIQKFQFGIEQLNAEIDKIEEYESNAKTIDESASKINKFYTNMNGDLMLDLQGNPVEIPDDSSIIYTSEPDSQGNVKMFLRDSDGNIKMETLNTGVVSGGEAPKVQIIGQDTYGNNIYGTYNFETGSYEPIKISGMETPGYSPTTTGGITATNFTGNQNSARTNRNNNPTAFTTDIAKQAGLIEGVDYVVGDAFPDNPNMFTAKLVGDGIETTKKVIDNIGFYTQSGQPRWTYLNDIFEGYDANQIRSVLTDEEKTEVIKEMYGYETDNQYENFGGFMGEGGEDIVKEYTANEKAIMDKYLSNPTSNDARLSLKRAGLTERDVNTYSTTKADAESIAFNLTSILPRDLYRTDADMGRVVNEVEKSIKRLEEKGLEVNQENIADDIRGFNIDEGVDKTISDRYREILNFNAGVTDRQDWTKVAGYINKGDYESVENYVRNIVEKQAKGLYGTDFVSTSDMNTIGKNIPEIINLINANIDKIGLYDGNWTKIKKKFASDKDIQRLQTLMTGTFADLRKYFAGSAVTDTELKALNDYISGDITEQPDNLITKLETILDMREREYLNQRSQFNYQPLRRENGKIIPGQLGETQSLGSIGAGLGASIGTMGTNLDEIDTEFFNPASGTGAGQLDEVDLEFFNNL